jgi:GT2 family glycosyltransferase/glycosyltransferase involved in cell wall biosynthesis
LGEGAALECRPRDGAKSCDVSVIIVNWNTRDLLRDCLASLMEHTRGCTYEIIVVDNASADGSAEMVRQAFPSVQLLVNDRNRGFAAGCNQGLARAVGRYLLLLNSDTRLDEDAVAGLVAFLDAHPRAGLVGCGLRNADGSTQPSVGHFPSAVGAIGAKLRRTGRPNSGPWRNFAYPFHTDEEHTRELDVDWVAGAAMLARREVVEGVGGLDESIFLFAEEWDWCYRIRAAGWRILFTPAVQIVHLGSGSWVFSQRLLAQSRRAGIFYFCRKHYGPLSAMIFQCFAGTGAAARMLLAAIAVPFAGSRRATALQRMREEWESLRWALSPAARRPLKGEDLAAVVPSPGSRDRSSDVPAPRASGRPRILFLDPIGHVLGAHDHALCTELRRLEFDVTLGTNDLAHEPPPDAGYRRIVAYRGIVGDGWRPGKLANYMRSQRSLLRELREHRYDAVLQYYALEPHLDAAFVSALRRLGAASVLCVHDVLPLHRGRDFFGAWRRAFAAPTRLVAFSAFARDQLVEELGLPQERIEVAHLGIERLSSGEAIGRAAARQRLGIPIDEPMVMCFGQLKRSKGLDVLIRAFADVAPRFPAARLWIVGRPLYVDLAPIIGEVRRLGLEDRIVFRTSRVETADVPLWFEAAEVVVLPYLRLYQSDVLLQACAHERPVVATAVGNTPELIRDRETGWLVRPWDALALARAIGEALSNPEEAAQLGQRARQELVERCSWSASAARVATTLRAAMADR